MADLKYLKEHEVETISEESAVAGAAAAVTRMRVQGGWIYSHTMAIGGPAGIACATSSCFVPDREFDEAEGDKLRRSLDEIRYTLRGMGGQ